MKFRLEVELDDAFGNYAEMIKAAPREDVIQVLKDSFTRAFRVAGLNPTKFEVSVVKGEKS